MGPTERSALPVCSTCKGCHHRETWRVNGQERNTCLAGHPMHEGCGWFRPKTESLIQPEEVK